MNFQHIKAAIKIQSKNLVTKESEQSICFESKETRFAVCDNGERFNIYQLTSEGVFLPGSKAGKSMRTISSFINARVDQ